MGFKIKKTVNGETVWEPIKAKKYTASKPIEYTGELPITLNANGNPLIDYRIYGNTVQNGTPTPENPIMPIGCGEKTENLFDKDAQDPNKGYMNSTLMYADESTASNAGYRVSEYISVASNTDYYLTDVNGNGTYPSVCFYDENKVYISGIGYDRKQSFGITTPSGTAYLRMTTAKFVTGVSMLTAGSTAPESYIPYGYKLPILSNSTVTNIYIGEVETTRRIKKLVLTGEETWYALASWGKENTTVYYTRRIDGYKQPGAIIYVVCDHYRAVTQTEIYNSDHECTGFMEIAPSASLLFRVSRQYTGTTEDFKSYLAAQYAAGTPVTVWYVLAEPETGIVNEPLMKIGNYADTVDSTQTDVQIPTYKGNTILDYDGTPKPSQMYIKYNSWSGWSDIDNCKMDNGNWTQEMT